MVNFIYISHFQATPLLQVDKHMVSGKLLNTGQTLVFRVEEGQEPVSVTTYHLIPPHTTLYHLMPPYATSSLSSDYIITPDPR